MKGNEAVKLLETSSLFDAQWYMGCYPDVKLSGLNAALHFFKYGWRMGRDPSPHFSTLDYLEMYQDVEKSGLNPLLHYLHVGKGEQRQITPARVKSGNAFLFVTQDSKKANEAAIANENKSPVSEQLNQTQGLLEFYYQRCQELEYKLLDC